MALQRQRVALPIPELKELLEAIYAKGSSYGFGFPAQLAGNLKDITEKQFSGFYGEAGNATSWLAIPSLARLVCGSDFRSRHLLSGRLDVFINLPLKVLQSSPPPASSSAPCSTPSTRPAVSYVAVGCYFCSIKWPASAIHELPGTTNVTAVAAPALAGTMSAADGIGAILASQIIIVATVIRSANTDQPI